jgi:PAS domain S-box-containing protein
MHSDARIGGVLSALEEASSSHVGQEFFRLLTRRLAASLNARGSFVAELLEGDAARIVCLWSGVELVEGREYLQTPDQRHRVLGGTGFFVPADVVAPDSPVHDSKVKSIATAPMFCRQGEPVGYVGVLFDQPAGDSEDVLLMLRVVATRAGAELKRMQAERALAESEERYRRLVEASPDIIYRVSFGDPTFKVEYVNPAIERILGHSPEDFYERPRLLLEMFAPEDREVVEREVLETNTSVVAAVRHFIGRDGKDVWLEVHNIPVYDDRGKRIAQEGVARDVTDRVLAEQALEERSSLQEAYLAAIPDELFRMNVDGSSLQMLPGGQADGDQERSLSEVIPADAIAGARAAAAAATRTGTLQTFHYGTDFDGETRTFEVRFVPSGGNELIGMLRDVTAVDWLKAEDRHRKAREQLEIRVEREIVHGNPYGLTFREFTVLHLVADGATDKEIAQRLAISPFTASKHVSSILSKLNVASRTEASVKALQEGLIERS